MFLKVRYMCYVIILNCLLISLVLRYFSRPFQSSIGNDKKITTRFYNDDRKRKTNITGREKRSCTPRKNVVFLKTHKTGSSTITNILNRYGEAHDLNFVLPNIGENRLDWPWFFNEKSYYPLNGSTPNILCNHARFNKEVIEKLMPNDTVFVTILRDPITQFESSFSYMTLDKILGMKNTNSSIEEFFKDPDSILINYVLTQDLRINSDRLKLIRNGMFYDLGLESKDFNNERKIREKIVEMSESFHLVMLMEHFDESLVLLRRLLCWSMDDMVYFRMKTRTKKWRQNISPTLAEKISRWSLADTLLYNHFKKTFQHILNHIDNDFWEEVRLLRVKNKLMSDLCLNQRRHYKAELVQTAETEQFHIRYDIPWIARKMCKRMVWDEIKYLKHLRELHIQKIRQMYENNPVQNSIYNYIDWIAKRLYL